MGRRLLLVGTAAVLGLVAVLVDPYTGLALVVFGSAFVVLERVRPLRRQRIFRPGFATDCVHFVTSEVLGASLVVAGLVVMVPVVLFVVPEGLRTLVHVQPWWLVTAEGLLVGELGNYWAHRIQHEVPRLWRFHHLHHTVETMDWVATARHHPVDIAFTRLFVLAPMVALGFGVPTMAAHFALGRLQGLFTHANIRFNAGPLTWLVTTPEFHHWHHADLEEAYDKNYASSAPVVDWLFGTLYLPHPTWPAVYGCRTRAPQGYVRQLAASFSPSHRPVTDRRAVAVSTIAGSTTLGAELLGSGQALGRPHAA